MPGVDSRVLGVAERRFGDRVGAHFGTGLMAVTMKRFPTMLCTVNQLGLWVQVSPRAEVAAVVDVPTANLVGPDLPGVRPEGSLWLRVRLGGARSQAMAVTVTRETEGKSATGPSCARAGSSV